MKSKRGIKNKGQFHDRVLQIVTAIPRGKVLTYREVACRAGSPGAYRAVGNILARNFSLKIPCHRVVRSDGTIGGYNRGKARKQAMLESERVEL